MFHRCLSFCLRGKGARGKGVAGHAWREMYVADGRAWQVWHGGVNMPVSKRAVRILLQCCSCLPFEV